jgi:uncharacterized membrane protein YdjX (TVP38/TMEM64 family)
MPNRRRSTLVLVAVAALVVVLALVAARFLELRAHMEGVVADVREAGPLTFFGAMALLPALGFPLSLFTVAAGPVFGPSLGVGLVIACAVCAVAINVALSYWVAAWAMRPLVERLIRRRGYAVPLVKPGAVWPALLLLRIVPGPPFWLQSSLLGFARVPFGPYLLVSTLVPCAYIAALVLFGDALMRKDAWAMAGAGGLFMVAGAIIHQVRKRLGRENATQR